jgi:hypothetical protein
MSEKKENKRRLKKLKEDESGLVWIIFFAFGLFSLTTLLMICMSPAVNGLIEHFNTEVASGEYSQQTYNAVEFNRNMFVAGYVIFLVGVTYWGLKTALEEKTERGE